MAKVKRTLEIPENRKANKELRKHRIAHRKAVTEAWKRNNRELVRKIHAVSIKKLDRIRPKIKPPVPPSICLFRPWQTFGWFSGYGFPRQLLTPRSFDDRFFLAQSGRGFKISACELSEDRVIEESQFQAYDLEGYAICSQNIGKSAWARAAAGLAAPEGMGHALVCCGFVSTFLVPQYDKDITVTITSSANLRCDWVEADNRDTTYLAYARGGIDFAVFHENNTYPSQMNWLVDLQAEPGEFRFLDEGYESGNTDTVEITVPPNTSRVITVGEYLTLYADANEDKDCAAHIAGTCTWDPLNAQIRGGCSVIRYLISEGLI